MSATSVAEVSDKEFKSAKFQLLFGSTKKIIDKHFLEMMEREKVKCHRYMPFISVSEKEFMLTSYLLFIQFRWDTEYSYCF